MKKTVFIGLLIFIPIYLFAQSIKEDKDSVFKEDTIITIEGATNLANYLNQFRKLKLNSKDLNIISCGNSKSEVFVNFLLEIYDPGLKNNNSKDRSESLSRVVV